MGHSTITNVYVGVIVNWKDLKVGFASSPFMAEQQEFKTTNVHLEEEFMGWLQDVISEQKWNMIRAIDVTNEYKDVERKPVWSRTVAFVLIGPEEAKGESIFFVKPLASTEVHGRASMASQHDCVTLSSLTASVEQQKQINQCLKHFELDGCEYPIQLILHTISG